MDEHYKLDQLGMTSDQTGVLMQASRLSSMKAIRELLRPYYAELVHYYENDLLQVEGDYRSGTETYGYTVFKAIQFDLQYIADRWRACYRVRWLIELINPDYKLWDGMKSKPGTQ